MSIQAVSVRREWITSLTLEVIELWRYPRLKKVKNRRIARKKISKMKVMLEGIIGSSQLGQ